MSADEAWISVSLDTTPGAFRAVPVPEGAAVAFAMTRQGIEALRTILDTAERSIDHFDAGCNCVVCQHAKAVYRG